MALALPTAKHCVALGQTTSSRLPTPGGSDLLVHVPGASVVMLDEIVVDGAVEVDVVVPIVVDVSGDDTTPSARGVWLPQAERIDTSAKAIIGPTR
jgi:hypothetical protein